MLGSAQHLKTPDIPNGPPDIFLDAIVLRKGPQSVLLAVPESSPDKTPLRGSFQPQGGKKTLQNYFRAFMNQTQRSLEIHKYSVRSLFKHIFI